MRTHVYRTVQLGDLVAAAFDEAALFSSDPKEVAHLATQSVVRMLRRSRNASFLRHHRRQETSRRLASHHGLVN